MSDVIFYAIHILCKYIHTQHIDNSIPHNVKWKVESKDEGT